MGIRMGKISRCIPNLLPARAHQERLFLELSVPPLQTIDDLEMAADGDDDDACDCSYDFAQALQTDPDLQLSRRSLSDSSH